MNSQAQQSSGNALSRRDFLKEGIVAGAVAGGSLGAFYFGYETPSSSRSRPSPTSGPTTSGGPSTATTTAKQPRRPGRG